MANLPNPGNPINSIAPLHFYILPTHLTAAISDTSRVDLYMLYI